MSNRAPHFTAYKDVQCVICSQPAHGQHFGVVTCRPCAAFFKRCVIERSTYRCVTATNQCNIRYDSTTKRCKACRLRQCNLVGMEYRKRKNSAGSSPEEEEEFMEIDKKVPISLLSFALKKLVAGYNLFLERQKIYFQRTYRNVGYQKIGMFVPESLDYIRHFVQSIRPMFYNLFLEYLEPFSAMDKEKKLTIFNECFDHLNLLNACYLSLKHFPQKNDQKFMIAYCHLMDMERKWEILQKWTKSNNQVEINEQREFIEKKFGLIQQLKKLDHKVGKEEICTLMAIIICIKSPSTQEWNEFKTTILSELFNSLHKRMNSKKAASKHLAKLLTLLGQIDMFLIKYKKMDTAHLQMPISEPSIKMEIDMEIGLNNNNKEQIELEYLNGITNAYKRIWANMFHISGEILIHRIEQFQTFDEFLRSNLNLLTYQNLFPEQFQMHHPNKEETIHEISQMKKITFHPRIQRKNIFSRLLNVGIFKAIMHYRLHQIPIEDQIILNIHNGPAINALVNTHFATQMGSIAWSDADGLCGITKLCAKRELREDGRFMLLAEKAWVRPVKHFSGISLLSQEEFSLLLAILCTHTAAISNISNSTKELLYLDQGRYSAFLLQYLQQKFGHEPGAKRYAECLQMLDAIFFSAHNFDLLRTYLEAFHFSHGFTSEIVPRCLHPLV